MADPLPPVGPCDLGTTAAAAEQLLGSIQSSRNLSVSAPVAARVGTIDAVQVDVTSADGVAPCPDGDAPVLAPQVDSGDVLREVVVGHDDRVRLHVFDVPGGRARTVAILVIAPTPAFERAMTAAQPILESFELGTD
jgi:hypothetical protein